MLDATQILQDVEELLASHYVLNPPALPQPAVALPTPPVKPTGVTELLGNLAFLIVLSVLDQSMARPSAR